MAIQAMWVPGYVAKMEMIGGSAFADGRPMQNVDGIGSTDLVGFATGNGIRFRGKANQGNWFHFPIPTPEWRDDRPSGQQHARVIRVFVLFKLFEESARLKSVHVWTGPPNHRRYTKDVNVAGDRSTGIDWSGDPMNANTWPVDGEPVAGYGLGISVYVHFGNRDGDVLFTAAGAHFRV